MHIGNVSKYRDKNILYNNYNIQNATINILVKVSSIFCDYEEIALLFSKNDIILNILLSNLLFFNSNTLRSSSVNICYPV